MNKGLTIDMVDANRLQRAIRPTRFFNIKKMTADFCSTQCDMDNTGSLTFIFGPGFMVLRVFQYFAKQNLEFIQLCLTSFNGTLHCREQF